MGLDNFQETRPESLFQDCSKYVFQASTQTSHQWFANRYSARHKHEGVAVLGLQEMASAELESVPTANHNFYTQPRITPNKTHLLNWQTLSMKMVVLFCGHGCRYAVEVMQLAEILKSPLGYSFRGKYFSNENPYAVGLNGLWATNRVLKLCIKPMSLMLGTDFPYSDSSKNAKLFK
jgi:pyruvate dehydrogenase (quinone)